MGTPIYKITEYVNWKGTSPIFAGASAGVGGVVIPPIGGGGLDGSGLVSQIAFWLDNNTLVGDEGLTYNVDSGGIGVLGIGIIQSKNATDTVSDGDDLCLFSGSVLAAGQKAGDVIIKAANAYLNDYTPEVDGYICLIPGNSYNAYGNHTAGRIELGDAYSTFDDVYFQCIGHEDNIGLSWAAKGTGILNFITLGNIQLSGSSTTICSPTISLGNGYDTDVSIQVATNYNDTKGYNLRIEAGGVYGIDIDQDGGDIFICGGEPIGTGSRGDIYFGDGSSGSLPTKASETDVVYYDPTTGKLSYGASGGVGDSLWQEDSIGDISPVTAGVDVYAHDFILIP